MRLLSLKRQLSSLLAVILLISLSLPFLGQAFAVSPNLVSNPSAETVDPTNSQSAQDWNQGQWGTNSSTFSYATSGNTGTRSLTVTTSAYTNGDAKWYFKAVAINPSTAYTFSDYYHSSAATSTVAQFDNGNGTYSYMNIAAVPAAASWTQTTSTFTSPATAKNVTVFHLINAIGSLSIDDASLALSEVVTPPVTPPITPPVTPPTTGNLIMNPSLETAGSTPALPQSWLQDGWGTNTAAYSYPTTGGQSGNRYVKLDVTKYTSGDAKWYFTPAAVTVGKKYTFSDYYKSNVVSSVVAQYDNGSGTYSYVALGTGTASTAWKQFTTVLTVPVNMKNVTIFHLLNTVGSLQTDSYSLTAISAPVVTVTAPTANTSVSGIVTLAATATDDSGIKNVQFMVDGSAQGAAVNTAPYQTTWDTTAIGNGPHSVTASATNTGGTTTTSAAVNMTVANVVSGNMIPNASVETVNSTDTKLPQGWQHGSWGTNTAAFTYLNSGHTGSRSLKAQITNYTNGSAYWYFGNKSIVAGQMYNFSDYYKSNIPSEIDAAINMSDGSVQYMYLGDPSPSPNTWTKFEQQFTAPAGAVSVAMYHNINGVGQVTTDDFSLTPFAYAGFNQPVVSLTFDDGYKSAYTNGLPLLQKYHLLSTQYIISGSLDVDTNYITTAMLKDYVTKGHEIGSHTVSHPDLTTLTAANADAELKNSQSTLQMALALSIKNFASPYGAMNDQVLTNAKKYYTSHRGVQAGFNAKNNFNAYNIRVQNVVSSTTPAEVQGWVQTAITTKTWLVLVYHQVDTNPAAGDYNTYPVDLDAELSGIQASGVKVDTVAQALAELTPQL